MYVTDEYEVRKILSMENFFERIFVTISQKKKGPGLSFDTELLVPIAVVSGRSAPCPASSC